jgi:hypothetical protein
MPLEALHGGAPPRRAGGYRVYVRRPGGLDRAPARGLPLDRRPATLVLRRAVNGVGGSRDEGISKEGLKGMRRGGDDREGFSVELDPRANVVRVAAWGFWGPAVAAAFSTEVLVVCADARARFALLADCSGLNPQRSEGQEAWGRLMLATGARVARAFAVVPNAVTKLQLVRIAKASNGHQWSFVPTLAAALLSLQIDKPQGEDR